MVDRQLVEEADERLRQLRAKTDRLKTEIARAEAGMEVAESRREEVRKEISALGVDPDRVNDELARLESEVRSAMEEVDAFLEESENLIAQANNGAPGASGDA